MINTKILVIGGTKGLGLSITKRFNATGIGRRTGHDCNDVDSILEFTEKFDVIINCLPDENQTQVVEKILEHHNYKELPTYFISVGSMSYRINHEDHVKTKLFRYNESLILKRTSVKHTLINPAELFSSETATYCEKTTEEEILEVFQFLLQTKDWKSNIPLIEINGKLFKDLKF